MNFVKFIIVVSLVGAGAFFVGFGLYKDAYIRTKTVKASNSKSWTELGKETSCAYTKSTKSRNHGIACSEYCSGSDDKSEWCSYPKSARAAKAMNILAYIASIGAVVMILLVQSSTIPQLFGLIASIASVAAGVFGLIAVIVIGAKRGKLKDEYDITLHYTYSYILVIIGSIFALIGGVYSTLLSTLLK